MTRKKASMRRGRGGTNLPAAGNDRKRTRSPRRSPSPQSLHDEISDNQPKRRRTDIHAHKAEKDSVQADGEVRRIGRGESYKPGRANDHSVAQSGSPVPREDQSKALSRGDFYRPGQSGEIRSIGRGESYRPGQKGDQTSSIMPRPRPIPKSQQPKPPTGLSDKIHSLKNLLSHPGSKMPADVRQEKERELAGYLADQQRAKAHREKTETLRRYHMVRFFERKKAENNLKKLLKEEKEGPIKKTSIGPKHGGEATQESTMSDDDDDEGGVMLSEGGITDMKNVAPAQTGSVDDQRSQLAMRIRVAKIDLNYTVFAPLDQKYISLFPKIDGQAKPEKPIPGSGKKWHGSSDGDILKDVNSGIFRNAIGQKPPLWYEVEKSMENGTLDALREGKLGPANTFGENPMHIASVGGRAEAEERSSSNSNLKRRRSWMEDEDLHPEDLDSEQSDGDFFER